MEGFKKEPYEPSQKEIMRAEETMIDSQKYLTEILGRLNEMGRTGFLEDVETEDGAEILRGIIDGKVVEIKCEFSEGQEDHKYSAVIDGIVYSNEQAKALYDKYFHAAINWKYVDDHAEAANEEIEAYNEEYKKKVVEELLKDK